MSGPTDSLRVAIGASLDAGAPRTVRFAEQVLGAPELAYRERRTSAALAQELRELGLDPIDGLALTGVKARLSGALPGPTVCVIGELDGLLLPDHPSADPTTGAAHACGHHVQLAHLISVARALVETDAARHLAGDVVFIGAPAEEHVDLEWGMEQVAAGRIEFMTGKSELIRIGAFDDVDLAVLTHAGSSPDPAFSVALNYSGLTIKRARFEGRSAHAGKAPELGINALYAANLAISALQYQRDGYRDQDHTRVSPIVTAGGQRPSVVPGMAAVESFLRAATVDALDEVARRYDRCMQAGALALGAAVEIETFPGYLPLHVDPAMARIYAANVRRLPGRPSVASVDFNGAATDAGDLSQLIPVLHPTHGGCEGPVHTPNFRVVDPTTAYVAPAKALAWTLVDLLADGAAAAKRIIRAYQPRMTREQYVAWRRGALSRTLLDYRT